VHDGQAESGHYYSFIFDRVQSIWWRFNDHSVTMESEDVVMRESIGGQKGSFKSAYMLIYTNQFIVSKAKTINVKSYIPKPLSVEVSNSNA
jgi:ubiquitin carboxyl-terminal hydrolase 25/28